jgi:hypothetical protein
VNNRTKYIIQAGLVVSLFFLVQSCTDKDKLIATVGDAELRESEAFVLMKHLGYNQKDKKEYKEFVQYWCDNEIFKEELKKNHPDDWDLVRLRGESYQGELAKFYLEEIHIKSSLDTIVKMKEIEDYYESHKDEFVLNDYIVKALYLKIPKDLDFKEEEVHINYLLKNDKDLAEINSYAKLYALNYYFDDSSWIYFDELSKDIPLTKYNVDNIVLNRTKTYFSDEEYWYFLNIIDYKLKDEAPPIGFLQDQIRGIIVSKRLNELREQNEAKLIKKLKKEHEVIIHL